MRAGAPPLVAAYQHRVPASLAFFYRSATTRPLCGRRVALSHATISRELGLLDLLRDRRTAPPSPEQANPDLEMEVELNTNKEPTKRPATAPSEGSPPPPIPTPVSHGHSRGGRNRPPARQNPTSTALFIHDRDAGPSQKQCDSKGIVILNGRNSIKAKNSTGVRHGLPKSILITCDAQSRLPYLLPGGTRNSRRPPGYQKSHRRGQGGPVNGTSLYQSVRRITNRARASGPSVGNSTGIDQTKRSFYRIKAVCSLSGVKGGATSQKSIPGQCFNCVKCMDIRQNCFQRARCVKCLGDHGTAMHAKQRHRQAARLCRCKSSGHGQLLRLSRARLREHNKK
ncbi:hypothetical protein EVAR_84802_1 [Eumeta japonica]|uniref:Uncharacterized protein n=1 Tax=Eumeta variegata TaxID=151549 RepID=A0A4C1U835_EUMVA|nr:hypothetical protein EVAR_84802_1 [Eumeta japonica]